VLVNAVVLSVALLVVGLFCGLVLMLVMRIVLKEPCSFVAAFNVALAAVVTSTAAKFVIDRVLGPGGRMHSMLGLAAGFAAMAWLAERRFGIGVRKGAIVSLVVHVLTIALLVLLLVPFVSVVRSLRPA
jgi:hypothetical protein